jgi:hypothetical protein
MADSTLSITVRDGRHPCAPYQTTGHDFFIQIYHCDGKPLFWKRINYGAPVPLSVPGQQGGRIHRQFRVPPGCYLVRGAAPCNNVVTEWAWVDVCCDETVCVNLVVPPVFHCVQRTILAMQAGTIGDQPVAQIAPREVEQALEALQTLADRLPRERPLPEPPTVEQVREAPPPPEEDEDNGGKEKRGKEK